MEAFILGLIGTVLSVASLTWQVFTWQASGARLHVEYSWGYPTGDGGPLIELRGITVTNKGRASTIVSSVTSRLPNGKHLPLVADALGQVTFPREIRPGESFTAYYEPDAIEITLRRVGLPLSTKLTPQASTGHGDVRGKSVPAQPR